jgi:hypothetical protein
MPPSGGRQVAPRLHLYILLDVALVKGVLYFVCFPNDHIAAYDLETETWRPDLLPLPVEGAVTLAELSDSLFAVCSHKNYRRIVAGPNDSDIFMELWFLTDTEKVLWSKRLHDHHAVPRFSENMRISTCHPLWALDNGKIVFWVSHYFTGKETGEVHLLRMYDPRTNTYTDGAEMPSYTFAGVFKGSLLAGLPWIRN